MSKNFKKYFKKHLHFDEITLCLRKIKVKIAFDSKGLIFFGNGDRGQHFDFPHW